MRVPDDIVRCNLAGGTDAEGGSGPPLPPPKHVNIRGFGHSFVAGEGAYPEPGFMDRMERSLDSSWYTMSHLGHPGYRTDQLLPLAPAEVDAYLVVGKINIFIYMEIVNSIAFWLPTLGVGPTITHLLATHLQMALERKVAGWDYVILYTNYPGATYTDDAKTVLAGVNAGLKAMVGGGIVDAVVDLAADPRFQVPIGLPSVVDGLHPSPYGHACLSDISLPVLYRAAEIRYRAPQHQWSPLDIGEVMFWYEADAAYLTKDGSNNVSELQDRSPWRYHLGASGALRPVYNPAHVAFSGKPTVDGAASCMTSTRVVDVTYTKKVYLVMLYRATTSGTILSELSANSTSNALTWRLVSTSVGAGGPEVDDNGNVGTSYARSPLPTSPQVKSVSFLVDHTTNPDQCKVLSEGVLVPGQAHADAPNTSYFGSFALNVFGRQGGSLTSGMSLAAYIGFSRVPSSPELTTLLSYLQQKWTH